MSNTTQSEPATSQTERAADSSAQDLDSYLHGKLPPEVFWERYLIWVGRLTRAAGAILWWYDEQTDELRPDESRVGPRLQNGLRQRTSSDISHVYRAMTADEIIVEEIAASAETGTISVSHAIRHGRECLGAVELLYPAQVEIDRIVKLVERALDEIGGAWKRVQTQEFAARDASEHWEELEEFLFRIHNQENFRQFADTAVNDGRVLLGCDRLSMATRHGRQMRMAAVSGQGTINRHSEDVRALEALAQEAAAVNRQLRYEVGSEDFPPEILSLFSQHAQETGARLIIVQPLYRYPRQDESQATDGQPQNNRSLRPVSGCLILENFHSRSLPEDRDLLLKLVCDHTGAALSLIRAQEEVLFLRTRRMLGRMVGYFRGRRLAKSLLALAGLAILVTSLILIPWSYRVEAEGQLMPSEQRHVFAPAEAVVLSLKTFSGERVHAGKVLAVLYDEDLHEELVRKRNEHAELQQSALSSKAKIELATRSDDRNHELQLRGELAETLLQINALEDDIAILNEREEALTIRAPIDGIVTTFQIKERLRNRPVQRGEMLLEIADETKPWRLELKIPEYRLGHVLDAVRDAPENELPVEYVLATNVDRTHTGTLHFEQIATRAEVDQEHRMIVRLYVETDVDQLPNRRIGAAATAKITCSDASLGYVLFGDVWEFFQRHLWF